MNLKWILESDINSSTSLSLDTDNIIIQLTITKQCNETLLVPLRHWHCDSIFAHCSHMRKLAQRLYSLVNIDGSMQKWCNSSALAMESHLFCIKPSILSRNIHLPAPWFLTLCTPTVTHSHPYLPQHTHLQMVVLHGHLCGQLASIHWLVGGPGQTMGWATCHPVDLLAWRDQM